MHKDKIIRIGVFFDGGYFDKVSSYYKRYHAVQTRLDINKLQAYIRRCVAGAEGGKEEYCRVVDSHYFRGRYSAYDTYLKGEQLNKNKLLNERLFEDVLMKAKVTTHYLPVIPIRDEGQSGKKREKGIDVWLALEAFELAMHKKFDVVALITGDGDYLPLITKLNTAGSRVMLLYWDLAFNDETGRPRTIRTSQTLIDEATYAVDMVKVLNTRKRDEMPDIFLERTRSVPPAPPHPSPSPPSSAAEPGNRKPDAQRRPVVNKDGDNVFFEGVVIEINEAGYGKIKAHNPEIGVITFKNPSMVGRYFRGDRVHFKVSEGQRDNTYFAHGIKKSGGAPRPDPYDSEYPPH